MRRALLLVLLAGCEARFEVPQVGGSTAETIAPPIDAPVPTQKLTDGWPGFIPTETFQLRRLTTDQYVSTVTALLGVSATGMPPIEPVSPVNGFQSIGASASVVSGGGVGQYEDASIFFSAQALSTPSLRTRNVPCAPSGVLDTTCFRAFVSQFGPKAFRRPLAPDEVDRYATLVADVATLTSDPWAGIEAGLSAFLQSPNFLYLSEVGEADPSRPGRFRFTAPELAARLSYFLTQGPPDAALLAAAASGELFTDDGVKAQAERLLSLPAARTAVRGFFTELLALNSLDNLSRPTTLFPRFTPTLGAALKEETLLALEDATFGTDRDYRALFDAEATYVNAELAAFYGLPVPSTPGFSRVAFPAGSPRGGLLSQAGVLAPHDNGPTTSPTRRGLFVLDRLLCQPLALSPPSDLDIPPPPTGTLTARQRLEQHVSNPTCAACHQKMDGVGLSLERFDSLGVYRETERGLPIDDSGALDGQTYAGAKGLGSLLRSHPAVSPCLASAAYAAGVGHRLTEFDKDGFGRALGGFDQSGSKVRALLLSITLSEGFRSPPAGN